jgi:hypothetical protein
MLVRGVQDETVRQCSGSTGVRHAEDVRCLYLPPMTFESPLKIFDKLVATMSANGRVSTLTKLPMLSSIIIRKSYLSARLRKRERSGDRKSGFEGNSVMSARIGGSWGFCACSASKIASSSSMEESKPWPKKWQPGPHFSRTLSVSV